MSEEAKVMTDEELMNATPIVTQAMFFPVELQIRGYHDIAAFRFLIDMANLEESSDDDDEDCDCYHPDCPM